MKDYQLTPKAPTVPPLLYQQFLYGQSSKEEPEIHSRDHDWGWQLRPNCPECVHAAKQQKLSEAFDQKVLEEVKMLPADLDDQRALERLDEARARTVRRMNARLKRYQKKVEPARSAYIYVADDNEI